MPYPVRPRTGFTVKFKILFVHDRPLRIGDKRRHDSFIGDKRRHDSFIGDKRGHDSFIGDMNMLTRL
jgi:hypothetical protein